MLKKIAETWKAGEARQRERPERDRWSEIFLLIILSALILWWATT